MKLITRTCLVGMILIIASCIKDEENEIVALCIPSSLYENIIAFYPFSNGSLNDLSGGDQHLSNSTSASSAADRNGNSNCAYEFDNLPNSTEFLTTSNTTFLDGLDEFSISLWYLPKDTSRAGGDFESLINRDLGQSCPDRNGQWSVGLYDCRKAVFGRTNSVWDNQIIANDCDQEIIVRTDNWNHLAATFNELNMEMKIYRNGVLQETSTGDGNCGSGAPSFQDIGDLFLGKDYTGVLDDVIIFNKTLSQQEVNTIIYLEACCEEE